MTATTQQPDAPAPAPFQSEGPMTYQRAEERMYALGQRIRAKETDYENAANDYADAEALYRKQLGERFGKYRGDGMAVEAAMTQARADCWNLSRERDRALAKSRKRLEELEDRRGDRVSLHRLVEWSTALELSKVGIHADSSK
jgi:hypothetical protein